MSKIPRINATEFIRALERMGFSLARQTGSHKIFKNKDGIRVTVPDHAKKTIHPKIIKSFLNDAKISLDDFVKSLKS